MLSHVINSFWLTPQEKKELCLTSEWELWHVNKYSLHVENNTCVKIQILKNSIIGLNPKSGLIYEGDFQETCFWKCSVLSFVNFVACFVISLQELADWVLTRFSFNLIERIKHRFWYTFGIQLACLEALLFEEVYGALTVSYLYKKLNKDVPIEVFSHFSYRHLFARYDSILSSHRIFYPAPCMQPIGQRNETLEVGDHTSPHHLIANIEEYERLKSDCRFEFISKI